jgi:hypothetical protein
MRGAFDDVIEGGYAEWDYEQILDVDPDALLFQYGFSHVTSEEFERRMDAIREDPVGQQLTAVRNDRLYRGGTSYQGPLINLFQTEAASPGSRRPPSLPATGWIRSSSTRAGRPFDGTPLENSPGFAAGINGRPVLGLVEEQATKAVCEQVTATVASVVQAGDGLVVETDAGDHSRSEYVVAATKNAVGYLKDVDGVLEGWFD